MDARGASNQSRVRFEAKLPLRAPPTAIDVPADLSRMGLSEIVNRLLLATMFRRRSGPPGATLRLPHGRRARAVAAPVVPPRQGISAERVLELEYVKVGVSCWSSIPDLSGLQRCGKSCRLRWMNYLHPDLKRGRFSQQEEDLIMALHNTLGNRSQRGCRGGRTTLSRTSRMRGCARSSGRRRPRPRAAAAARPIGNLGRVQPIPSPFGSRTSGGSCRPQRQQEQQHHCCRLRGSSGW